MQSEYTVEFEFKLGAQVRTKIEGITGTITSRVNYITGCNQFGVRRPLDKDGNQRDVTYWDGASLELVDSDSDIAPKSVQGKSPGGPNADSPSH